MKMSAPSVQRLSSGSFECLGSTECEGCQNQSQNNNTTQHYWYRSGATFEGLVEDYKKTGRGVFTWPNGARYEGDYFQNKRNGKGAEIWPDGSKYDGNFVDDLRHGKGQHYWPNGESYQGSFFHDRRHGTGTYSWPDGSSYTGTFYMDKKEGYGKFTFLTGNFFEGLYREDVRFGPGVLTYPDKRQDVGVWHGEKLIKLCTSISGAFSIELHPEFDCDFDEHVTYLEDLQQEPAQNNEGLDFDSEADISQKMKYFFQDTLDPRSFAVNRKIFDEEFFKDNNSNTKQADSDAQSEKTAAWNKTPFMVEIQRHILKHEFRQGSVSFNVDMVLKGDRSKHGPKGELELTSERLLLASMAGNHKAVLHLLDDGKVHVNVSDKHGHTALIGAVINVHIPIINTLLDYGADVNRLNDEGCSALAALCVYYYPVESFLKNMAENNLQDQQKDSESERSSKQVSSETSVSSQRTNSMKIESCTTEIADVQTPVMVKSTCDSKISMDSGVPASVVRSETSAEAKTPSGNDLNSNFNNNRVKKDHLLHPPIKDEDQDSALESEDEYAANLCDLLSPEDFESGNSLRNYPIEVTESLLERCATDLSQNEQVVSGRRSRDANSAAEGRARFMAIQISERELMKKTLDLLLRRGANPSVASVPMPVLFFAIKAADVEVVRTLLEKGADTSARLTAQKGGLAPLHIAVAIPGIEGCQISQLLLEAQCDANVRAAEDNTYLNTFLEEEWSKDVIEEAQQALLGGRTPLHIACSRDDDYKNSCRVVRLLLDYGAKPDLLCNGFSPLALAIASGNDMAIDELLTHGANPSLRLTHGSGSALCVAASTEYEHRRSITQRLALIDKLIRAGADIMGPIPIGPKRLQGTAVDYAYYVFNQDRVIAHMPYHALTYAERETYNSRRKLLGHLGNTLRKKAMEAEKLRRERTGSTSPDGASSRGTSGISGQGDGHVTFKSSKKKEERIKALIQERKPVFKYCYECGRSVGVRLTPCTRCREVYYCSKACKLRAWTSRHKQECVCITGHSASPRRVRSSSPISKQLSMKNSSNSALMQKTNKEKRASDKITVPLKGRSKSAKIVRQKVYVDRDGNRISSADALLMSDARLVYIDNYSFV